MEKLSAITLSIFFLSTCGSSSSGGSGNTGTSLNGTVTSFTASLNVPEPGLLARVKSLFLKTAKAQVDGVTVTIDDDITTTTNAGGYFELTNFPTGNGNVLTFTYNSTTLQYLLAGVDENEAFELGDIQIANNEISTAHTGQWSGTLTDSAQGTMPMVFTLGNGGNTYSGEAETGNFLFAMTGTDNGEAISGTIKNTGTVCTGDTGTMTGTFSGSTLTGHFEKTGGTCAASAGTFSVTKDSN